MPLNPDNDVIIIIQSFNREKRFCWLLLPTITFMLSVSTVMQPLVSLSAVIIRIMPGMNSSSLLDRLPLGLWFLFFFVGNHIYFIRSEEPGLLKRFGDEYAEYFENVPRWLPRRTPWTQSDQNGS